MHEIVSIPKELAPIARIFFDAGEAVYAVGGMVRNALLGVPPSDIDIASGCTPERVRALCEGTGVRMIPKAVEFGTVELHCGEVSVEHTTFRRERYASGGAHRPERVELTGTLETDALRRDFTINALYAALDTGALIDPTGGLADLKSGVLRTTSREPDAILRSDALRVLRLVRFACELGFAIEPETFRAACAHAPALADIARERLRDELGKLLLCDVKYPALSDAGEARSVLRALTLVDELDAWKVLIPQLEACRGCMQRPDHHRYDVLNHLYHACAAAPPTLVLRLAALLHDIGKPPCRAQNGNLHDHARMGEPIARDALHALRYSKAMTERVCTLVRYHMYDIQNTARESTLRVRFATWGRELTQQLIDIREADIVGCGYDAPDYRAARWRTLYAQMLSDGTPFCPGELAIDGAELMRALGIAQGAQVGAIKNRLFLHCARHPRDNEPARLLRLARGVYRELGQGKPACEAQGGHDTIRKERLDETGCGHL